MRSKYVLACIILIVAIGMYFLFTNRNNKKAIFSPVALTEKNQTPADPLVNNEGKPGSWNDYTNERLGIYFQYPSTWVKQKMEVEAINLSGRTTVIEVNFHDTSTNSTFQLSYHFPPNGLVLFKQVVADFNDSKGNFKEGREKLIVAEKDAYKARTNLKQDGRGKPLNPPIELVTVYFLDKNQPGEFEMQLKAPVPVQDSAELQLNQVLSSFKFIEKK